MVGAALVMVPASFAAEVVKDREVNMLAFTRIGVVLYHTIPYTSSKISYIQSIDVDAFIIINLYI